ncbi:MAG: glutamate synthase-related protein [Planctomycetota bacterium]
MTLDTPIARPSVNAPDAGWSATTAALHDRVQDWEDVLVLIVDPESTKVEDLPRKRRLLSFLLERAGLEEQSFWRLSRGQRGRLFLSRYSRVSRSIPQLEITSFDLDKVAKERFRHEPLTLGAAWHFGFWRSYFSHAAITHPANDGLREEFSTAWDITRREQAVLFRSAEGTRLHPIRMLELDMPMIVGPLPYSDGRSPELAYLRAIERADPEQGVKTRSLVVVEAANLLAHRDDYLPHMAWVLPRLTPDDVGALGGGELDDLVRVARLIEVVWTPEAPAALARLRELFPAAQLAVYLEHGEAFWSSLEAAVRTDGVAMVEVHSGDEKSYRLIPKVDNFLKARFLRARIQLVSAGGNTDTHSSAATAYEAVLLGANGAAMTHIASLALVPGLVDVHHGADSRPLVEGLGQRDPGELEEQARGTLSCWQHSILDFLSCMGIDDIKKTSGNAMAITMTEDWIRETDRLATPDFAEQNRALNKRRVEEEKIPADIRERFKITSLLDELAPDVPFALTATVLAGESSSWHLANTNRSLTADFLEIIYRMAAGMLPTEDDFFVEGDLGLGSLDDVGLRLSKESIAWSLKRLREEPEALDYISLAVPRGFLRPGAVPPRSECQLRDGAGSVVVRFDADDEGGFDIAVESGQITEDTTLRVVAHDPAATSPGPIEVELVREGHGGRGQTVLAGSADGTIVLKRDPRGGMRLTGFSIRRPIWQGPVGHASISLGAASEDFLVSRIRGSAGLAFTSSGEGGPLRLESDEEMAWESLQAASGHFGIESADLRRVRDVEIKINQGAKPGKGGRLSGAKVTPQVSRARNIPVGTNALSPDPKHDIYSIEDMPAEVWLWLLYHNHCGIKIAGSSYTRYVAAGMWSNFVVDYLLIDSGIGGSGNYHADSSHVGWPDIFRTILHTHHALVNERVDLDGTGELRSIRDLNGAPFRAKGGTRLFASGGLRGELDMMKVLIAGADGVVEASIGKAVAFGCNQCGNCHLDCPRGGITTKPELLVQNELDTMTRRIRNWTVVNLLKLAVMIDALNLEHGALDETGRVLEPERLLADVRELRGRVDLLKMPEHPEPEEEPGPEVEHDSCRVGSLCVSVPVTVHAIWEGARHSMNGGNNRGGGLDFAGFAPPVLREKTCLFFNTIGPDRRETMVNMLDHLECCRFFDARGEELEPADVAARIDEFRVPVREQYQGEGGWRRSGLREEPGDYYFFFVELRPHVVPAYGKKLVVSENWLQRRTKYGDLSDELLLGALEGKTDAPSNGNGSSAATRERLDGFVTDVKEEFFTALSHILDTRFYRTHSEKGAPAGKYAEKRRGYLVSIGEDLGAIKVSGWTHLIPEYFDFDGFWGGYPGAQRGGVEVRGRALVTTGLYAHVWGLHHRYPTNSPAIDAEGRGNPAGAHPFKSYNVLLMHNGEQVGVDSTAPFLCEYGYVHAHEMMGPGAADYEGDSYYERKALTDTEYAAYLFDFTRRILGLDTEEASQVISPITGIDLASMDESRREKLELLMRNYVQLTPTGPYKFTVLQSQRKEGERVVGFRENMDIKFLRPHEIVSHRDLSTGGPEAVANGSEAKIADSMLRVLRERGVLKDGACDLRFNMRAGGRPRFEEHGGVFEAFVIPDQLELTLVNRFGEEVPVKRAGNRVDLSVPLRETERMADLQWKQLVDELVDGMVDEAVPVTEERLFGPEDPLPSAVTALIEVVLQYAPAITFQDYRYLAEVALPRAARRGDSERALALRVLTELRKRLVFADLGPKALSSMEYITDGGRDPIGAAEGGIYRILDDVPAIGAAWGWGRSRYLRIDADSLDDLVPPADAARDVLVIRLTGFESESFTMTSCSRFVSECVKAGWRNLIGYDARGGPRYIGTNFADGEGVRAEGVHLELYGRELGDFIGALLEGARIYVYGQAQSHVGFKADSGYLFVLQDALNTCMYSAHGGTFSVWDSGSRYAVAGQNKVYLADGVTFAPGFRSIHFGNPNEYAFEYLMSGGENSIHLVLGLKKPGLDGELSLRPKPYMGKFLMSGAAAGRVVVLDPDRKLDPAQYGGNEAAPIEPEEWRDDIAPFLDDEARRRGIPIRIQGESVSIRLEGRWRSWRYDDAFVKLVPRQTARSKEAAQLAAGAVSGS